MRILKNLMMLVITLILPSFVFADYSNLKEAVNATEPATRSYSFGNDEIVTEDLGNLGGEQLTIFGNGYEVISSSQAGITVSSGQTLDIDKGTGEKFVWRNFYLIYGSGSVLNNAGTINIGDNVEFSSNTTATGEYGRASGGAIYNSGTINIGSGAEFSSNTATATATDTVLYSNASGGAIYNRQKLTIGDGAVFSSNTATTIVTATEEGSGALGGAIYNENKGKVTIGANAVFSSNTVTVTATGEYSEAYGGAICNGYGTVTIGDGAVFSSNTATATGEDSYASGGAISSVEGELTIGDGAVFISNTATATGEDSYAYGGAISSYEGIVTIGANAVFSSNTATTTGESSNAYGGAIYNGYDSIVTIENGAIFNHNVANSSGGAIHNDGILNLIADTNNVEFTSNTANGVSNAIHDNAGTINLWASSSADIIFNDRITSENNTSVLNINSSTTTLTANGKVILNEDMSGYTGTVNLYNGEIELQAKGKGTNTNKFFSGNINFSSGTINLQNNAIDNITVSNWNSTKNSNLKFDTDLSNNTSDNFIVTNSASGDLNLTAINILGVDGNTGTITLFNNEKSPNLNILTTASYGGYEYLFSTTTTKGLLTYQKGEELNLKKVINKTTPTTRSYSFGNDEIVTEDLGNLGGEQLTIFGNGYEVNGSSHSGITVSQGQTLNIDKGTGESFVWKKFLSSYGSVIDNAGGGTINISSGVKFSSNTAGSYGGVIFNNSDGSTVNIGEGTEFSFNTAGDYGGAIFNVNGGMTNISSRVVFSSNTAGSSGGVICNGDGSTVNIGEGTKFSFNTASNTGGAIINSEGTINIESWVEFSSNTAYNYGGAIQNSGKIIFGKEVKFDNNSVISTQLIDSDESILEMTGGTINNYVDDIIFTGETKIINSSINANIIIDPSVLSTTITGQLVGGGLCNNAGGEITFKNNVLFENNIITTTIESLGTEIKNNLINIGGAVANCNTDFSDEYVSKITFDKKTDFINNSAETAGAILNMVSIANFNGITTFENNEAISEKDGKISFGGLDLPVYYGSGGAILNLAGILNMNTNTIFESNKAKYGGAIYNTSMNAGITSDGTLTIVDGVKFIENTAEKQGGAIYNAGILNLIADTNNVEFTNNTANGISNAIHDNAGTINLWASDCADIIFNDRITSEDNTSILNINSSTTTITANGKIVLNEDMSGYTGTVNLYNGEIELQAKGKGTNTNKFFSGNINFSSGTLNILNNSIDNITVSKWTSTVNSNLKFDIDLSNNTSDNFTVTNSASGNLNLTAINILGVNEKLGTITLFNNEISPELNVLTTGNYGGYEYVFSTTTKKGILNYKLAGYRTFKETVNATEPATRSYSFGNDEIVTEDLGNLGGEQLTIFGNGYEVNGSSHSGITVSQGQTLNIDKGTGESFVWKKFLSSYGSVIDNAGGGTINISSGVKFSSNTAGDYGGAIFNVNGGMTNISSRVVFSSNTAGYGGAIFNSDLDATVNIGEGTKFSFNTAGDYGGAIFNVDRGIINISSRVVFSSNAAGGCGGVIFNSSDGSTVNIGEGTEFSFNIAGDYGGAIFNVNGGMTNISSRVVFSSNTAGYGGAIFNSDVNTTLNIGEGTKFSFNTASNAGGAIINSEGTINIESGVEFSSNTAGESGGAICNYYNGIINLIADTNNVEFTNNTANGISNAIHDNAGTINLWASDCADIIFNDRITSEDNTSILNINSSTTTITANGKVVLNEDMRGYTGKVNLYNGRVQFGQKGTWFGGNTYVDNATIDMANTIIQEHNFKNLTIDDNLNLFIDADLENKQMDTISADDYSGDGKINVRAINILSDAIETKTEVLFTSSTVLKDNITSINTVSSQLFKYDVNYDKNTGNMNFLTSKTNPIIAESQVASAVGGIITQNVILNQAFASIDSVRQSSKQSHYQSSNRPIIKSSNLYASTAGLVFEQSNGIESGLWIRPYAIQDNLTLNDLSIDNTAIGTLAGLDLSVGENSLLSLYIGYAGSNQKYEDIKVNQTGYVLGATGMIIKENYYLGLTANINFNKASGESAYGTDDFDMNMYAIGAKAGYDIDLGKKWILEPNLTLMYGNIRSQDYTTKQGAKVDGQSTNNVLIEPQVKAKLDLVNGWTPYALVGYMFNSGEKTKLVVNNIAFEDMQISGYMEYGLGINKVFKDSAWSCFIQAIGKGGDRSGFEGNLGVKYSFSN